MDITAYPHGGKYVTARLMRDAVKNYWGDLGDKVRLPLAMWYAEVKGLPYQSDDEIFGAVPVLEVIARPRELMDRILFPALDCKKKSVLMAAWAEGNSVPWDFLGVIEDENAGDIHHVLVIMRVSGVWIPVDATFVDYVLGEMKPAIYMEVL